MKTYSLPWWPASFFNISKIHPNFRKKVEKNVQFGRQERTNFWMPCTDSGLLILCILSLFFIKWKIAIFIFLFTQKKKIQPQDKLLAHSHIMRHSHIPKIQQKWELKPGIPLCYLTYQSNMCYYIVINELYKIF